jgi:D-alanine-D-alanine ligase
MKVAVVYNRDTGNVINLFGTANREKIGLKTIERLTTALKTGGHSVIALEGDKDLVDRLEEFMPRVVKGERPGLVFNVSYGIQGQARYTHVPSILEMVGIPYVASGPLAHSLCLDKVVTKMILRQQGLPTPDFAVLQTPDSLIPEMAYPLIVKPKNEAVSFGLKVVENEAELRDAAKIIYDEFRQAVLAEQFIKGREVNVGLLGNDPPEAFPPVELNFGADGPKIYTYEDKTGKSGRTISHSCPAPIGEELLEKAKDLARQAFVALSCYDCARVDMRLDNDGQLYILEINSLPSLGEHGSYLVGAEQVGLDFTKFINRLVDVASARYFGTPTPPAVSGTTQNPSERVFHYVTERRDQIEKRVKEWVNLHSRTTDPIGVAQAIKEASRLFEHLGLDDGLLFIANLDVPVDVEFPPQSFRRDPEWLYGEGVGSSRASLVMLEFALRALRSMRRLRQLPLGVMCYSDEGLDGRYSADEIRAAAARAKEVIVLRPGLAPDKVVTGRRGQRRFRLQVEGEPHRLGRYLRKPDTLQWTWSKLDAITKLTSQKQRLSVATIDLKTEGLPMRLPHRVTASLLANYPTVEAVDSLVQQMRDILGKGGPRWELVTQADRPPFSERQSKGLFDEFSAVAAGWDIPLGREKSAWPSVAGLVPSDTACLCGVGPVTQDLRTPKEAVQRISLIQRTLLLAEFLAGRLST